MAQTAAAAADSLEQVWPLKLTLLPQQAQVLLWQAEVLLWGSCKILSLPHKSHTPNGPPALNTQITR